MRSLKFSAKGYFHYQVGHVAYTEFRRCARVWLSYNSRPSMALESGKASMQATAIAQPNIALIKYWGKRDIERNLPAVGSISITLNDLFTEVSVEFDDKLRADSLTINGAVDSRRLLRMQACLDHVIGEQRMRARITSQCNFPIAAGLASSASAFAAATVAAAQAAGLSLAVDDLARMAGRASGSAARSLYGGIVELSNCGDTIKLNTLCDEHSWPLKVVVAITEKGPKHTSSTDAMEISRKTSPFYGSWLEQQGEDLQIARAAVEQRDFAALAAIAEHNCLKMHSVMWASRPAIVFWNAATTRCLQTVRRLQEAGRNVFFTIDAGPQVKAVCLPEDFAAVREALSATEGVAEIMSSGLGPAARLVSNP
jgi:diphosphomevalonate decarboxylase